MPSDICIMLDSQLATQQAKLSADLASQTENATDIAAAAAALLAADTGAPNPLTEAAIGPRISALQNQTPFPSTLVGQYYGLLSLYYLADGWTAQIAADNANIAATEIQLANNGCLT